MFPLIEARLWPDTPGILSRCESRPTIDSTCMVEIFQPVLVNGRGNLAPTIRHLSAIYGYASHKCQQNLKKSYNEKVKRIFRRFRLSLQHVNTVAGWFDETLQTAGVQTIALLHIDADWYASVKIVLETFYDKVVEGGFVVLDDYWRWPGYREAVTDYLKEHQIQGVVLKKADLHGVYFQKPPRRKRETTDN